MDVRFSLHSFPSSVRATGNTCAGARSRQRRERGRERKCKREGEQEQANVQGERLGRDTGQEQQTRQLRGTGEAIAGTARRTIFTYFCVTAAEGTKDQRDERRREKKERDTGREGIRGKIQRYRDIAIARVEKAPEISTGYGSGGWPGDTATIRALIHFLSMRS